jgi:cysteine desulfurase/selenocysteine lyase
VTRMPASNGHVSEDPSQHAYLDHAATSWPKPPAVVRAVTDWFERLGVSPGRGNSLAGDEVADRVASCRSRLGRLVDRRAEHVLFTSGATESLNLALAAVLGPALRENRRPRVLTTDLEHNAIARPLTAKQAWNAEIVRIPCDGRGLVDDDAAARELERADRFDAFAFTTASNVTGAVFQQASAWCERAREAGVPTVVDACQTIGALPHVDAPQHSSKAGARPISIDADLIAASGHKSLLGPPGVGFLAVADRFADRMPLQRFGGTGSSTALDVQPDDWPSGREPGTPNAPGILGLEAALRATDATDARAFESHTRALRVVDRLQEVVRRAGFEPIAPATADDRRLPILAAIPRRSDADPSETGLLLAEHGITVRTGHCCAPWIHDRIGSRARGVLRVSAGPYVDPARAEELLAAALAV